MFTARLKKHPLFREVVNKLSDRPRAPVLVGGVIRPAAGFFLGALAEDLPPLPHLVLTPGTEEADALMTSVSAFGNREYVLLPSYDVIPLKPVSPPAETLGARAKALSRITTGSSVIAPVSAVVRRLPPPDVVKNAALVLSLGAEYDLDDAVRRLFETGYKREDFIEAPGQFSRRGGILDVFPPTDLNPIRVEFFGDAVESIRTFDVINQRRIGEIDRVEIFPAAEIILTGETKKNILRNVYGRFGESAGIEVEDALDSTGYFEGIENLLPFAYPKTATILDYFRNPPLIFLLDGSACRTRDEELTAEYERLAARPTDGVPVPEPNELFVTLDELIKTNAERKGPTLELVGSFEDYPTAKRLEFNTRAADFFGGRFEDFTNENRRLRKKRVTTLVTCDRPDQPDIFLDLIRAHDPNFEASFTIAHLGDGFVWEDAGVAVFPARNVVSKRRPKPPRPRKFAYTEETVRIESPFDLKSGDLIVHTDHGIGRYLGLKEVSLHEGTDEYIALEYAGGDKLYVPVYNLRLVQKYTGGDASKVPLSRLGGPAWRKAKARAKRSAEKMARQLIEIYAFRAARPGFGFSPVEEWEEELAESFPFAETPDQSTSIGDTYADMAGERPMDRLICADVGFGKTEVAVRAALRAVAAGKQVAFLAPTTILAEQHYNTFRDRLAPFPIIIETLSRLKTPALQKEILLGLAEGDVDIVIGTHRLLSKDVLFRDLGLLIIDEEQKFGVRHKEKIKAKKKTVDVLTLTATPIPRTLYMAFSGLRDLSIINTPPVGRLPIRTYVAPFDENLIVEAINRELSRSGQVYVVHNRVQTIDAFAKSLEDIMPDVRFAVVHGRIDERELEDVMLRFLAKEVDVLVSSSIIESGLDIPNVNTIIIDRADLFGLSQLHQLRGRVGRSHERAYAYLLTPATSSLTDAARERLLAVKGSTELGSGFRIATRDLEIRGAGSLLGAEQHGHITAVGLDIYTRLLAEAVAELKGEKAPVDIRDVTVESETKGFLPRDYVPGERERLDIYRRISETTTLDELKDMSSEIRDRFGPAPNAVDRLLDHQSLRILAQPTPVKSLKLGPGEVELELLPEGKLTPDRLPAFDFVTGVRLDTSSDGKSVRIKVDLTDVHRTEQAAKKILETLGIRNEHGDK
jgi:transcription-repair coupling factor (superfamily II helicase)